MFLNRYNVAVLMCLIGAPMHLLASELCVTVIDEADLPLSLAWVNVSQMVKTSTAANTVATVYHAATDSEGKACLAVPEGSYAVEVGLMGFLSVRYQPVRVRYPYSRTLKFRLPIGDVS
jgi:hypothetical protein